MSAFRVDSTLTGIHSRSEDTVKVSRDYDRGRTGEMNLARTFEKDSRDLVALQISSGITLVSDGQIKWQDFIRPFSESLKGLESGADLSRWFDTNSFYRKPTVIGELKTPGKKGFPIEKYEIASAFPSKKRREKKISIPGPYTLASLVDDKYYGSRTELTSAFAKILSKIINDLATKGFKTIQINEPALVYRYGVSALTNKEYLKGFLNAFERHLSKAPSEIILHTYFGDCTKILKNLIELEGPTAIGIDFTQTSLSDIEKIKFGDKKALACGCVDGRNSLLEPSEWITKYCEEAVRTLKPGGLIVLPSSELKYLPRKYADQKIRAIGEATSALNKRLN
ncbi:MAG: hypothetical protein ACYC7D_08365 [Nitrososphaerales archaeon]